MTESVAHVLVPYSRFLECQDRRHRIAAELRWRDQPPTIDAAPDGEYPVLDINGTSEHLDVVARNLPAALTSRSVSNADTRSPR